MLNIFAHINYWAVLVSAIVYWVIGMLWFSVIIGKDWSEEMKNHGIKLAKLTSGAMTGKFIWTFVLNFIVALGVAFFVNALGITTIGSAIGLGLILAIFFAVVPMITGYLWEHRSCKLSFYDVFYPFLGIIISAIIIALWP